MRGQSVLGRLFLVMAVLAALWVAWVTQPPRADQAAQQLVLENARMRRDALFARAGQPAVNGALQPAFAGWWRAKGSSPAQDALLQNWIRYSSQSELRYIDHQALQSDSRYLKARNDFEKLVPDLKQAWSKPVFCGSSPALSDDLRLVVLRKLALGLTALAEDQSARGQADRSIRSVYPVLAVGNRYLDRELMIDHLLGLAMLDYGSESLLYVLDRGGISPAGWRFLKERLPLVTPSQSLLPRTLAGEMLFMREHYADPPIGAVTWRDRIIQFAPGMEAREQRLLENFMLGAYQAALADEIPSVQQDPFRLQAWLIGRQGYYESELSFNVTQAARVTSRRRRILAACCVLASLEVYRAENAKYPPDLSNLTPLDGLNWEKDFHYEPGRAIEVKLPTVAHSRARVYPTGKNVQEGPDLLTFVLSPPSTPDQKATSARDWSQKQTLGSGAGLVMEHGR